MIFTFDDAGPDRSVPTSLAPLDPLVAGRATIGDVAVDYAQHIEVLDFGYAGGLNDRLSIGFHVPCYRIDNDVDSAFVSSSAAVGLNPAARSATGATRFASG